jgi:hypothetical protein
MMRLVGVVSTRPRNLNRMNVILPLSCTKSMLKERVKSIKALALSKNRSLFRLPFDDGTKRKPKR